MWGTCWNREGAFCSGPTHSALSLQLGIRPGLILPRLPARLFVFGGLWFLWQRSLCPVAYLPDPTCRN